MHYTPSLLSRIKSSVNTSMHALTSWHLNLISRYTEISLNPLLHNEVIGDYFTALICPFFFFFSFKLGFFLPKLLLLCITQCTLDSPLWKDKVFQQITSWRPPIWDSTYQDEQTLLQVLHLSHMNYALLHMCGFRSHSGRFNRKKKKKGGIIVK